MSGRMTTSPSGRPCGQLPRRTRTGRPRTRPVVLHMESEICVGAPFMRDWDRDQELGNIYEMRTYTLRPRSIPEMIDRWAAAIGHREKYSPLAACWYTDIGTLNRWTHIWPLRESRSPRPDPRRGAQRPQLATRHP